MNNKGFTLVELLAVIVIISVVSLIAVVSVSSVRHKMAQNIFASKLEHIVQAAENFGQDNENLINSSSNSMTIAGTNVKYYQRTVTNLINSGALDTDERDGSTKIITNNMNGKNIGTMKVRIYQQYNRYYACIVKDSSAQIDNLDDFNYLNYYCP